METHPAEPGTKGLTLVGSGVVSLSSPWTPPECKMMTSRHDAGTKWMGGHNRSLSPELEQDLD